MKKTLVLLSSIGLIFSALAIDARAQTIIVDDSSPGFTASTNWLTGTGGYGGTFRYRLTAPVSDAATWSASFKLSGTYKISAWWVSGVNRTTSAPYIVYHSGGTTTVNRNQQVNGGQWNVLGTFNLNSGVNQVRLSPWTATGYVIIADAIMWQQ
ncbi:MAG: hypothetical protein H0X66_16695 [Verrucomicrobia bacterium]|nr:hypothetical protein [Verrucomicrobiota bacterium]